MKANAYGHGVLTAADAFSNADGLCPDRNENAIRLRESRVGRNRILLLEGCFRRSTGMLQLSTG